MPSPGPHYSVAFVNAMEKSIHSARYAVFLEVLRATRERVPATLDIGGDLTLQAAPAGLTFQSSGPPTQKIKLTAGDGVSLGFTFVVATASGGEWLTVTSDSNFTPATHREPNRWIASL